MPNRLARFANGVAFTLLGVALSTGSLQAQGTPTVSAWISPSPITVTGTDSDKVVLSVKISGIPEATVRALKPSQIVLRAASGRVYMPFGVPSPVPSKASASVVATFYRTAATSAGQYLFLVSPGTLRYELWLPGLRPVSFAASLVRPAAR